MPAERSIAIYALLTAAGASCQPAAPNVMMLSGVCDSTPPSWTGSAASTPSSSASDPERGTLVGSVVQLGTRRPLWGAQVAVYPDSISPASNAWSGSTPFIVTDSLGGFQLRDYPPGIYRLWVRMLVHRFQTVDVRVSRGRIDTIAVHLQFYSCAGY
jgi:hypothetical protein